MTDDNKPVSRALRAATEHLAAMAARREHHHELTADELRRRLAYRVAPLATPPPEGEKEQS